ncbi:hypothetical protein WJ968_12540 [Achromobacter xylosoxidans]
MRLICSSPPGAPLDVISRRLAESLSRQLGVAVVVENKPGAAACWPPPKSPAPRTGTPSWSPPTRPSSPRWR